jgi:hypothetical protein
VLINHHHPKANPSETSILMINRANIMIVHFLLITIARGITVVAT